MTAYNISICLSVSHVVVSGRITT